MAVLGVTEAVLGPFLGEVAGINPPEAGTRATLTAIARSLGMEHPDRATAVEMLVNPCLPLAGCVRAVMETARDGPPRYDLFISMSTSPAFAFSAFRYRVDDGGFEYRVRMSPRERSLRLGADTFCASLKCSADCTRYTLCDDPSNFYSYPRELGAVFIGGGGRSNRVSVILPRVLPSGAAAQFRVLRPEDGIIARFLAGQAREHTCTLSGVWSSKEGGSVELALPASDGEGSEAEPVVVFRARQSSTALSIQYSHPLSAYQVRCLLVLLFLTISRTSRPRTPSGSPPVQPSILRLGESLLLVFIITILPG